MEKYISLFEYIIDTMNQCTQFTTDLSFILIEVTTYPTALLS